MVGCRYNCLIDTRDSLLVMYQWIIDNLLALVLALFAGLGVVLTVHHRLKSVIEALGPIKKDINKVSVSLEDHKVSFEDYKTKSLIVDERHRLQIEQNKTQLDKHEAKCEIDKKEIFRKIDAKADKG